MFKHIDTDGSGVVEFNELKDFVDQSMEIQDFILRYSGVQTIIRARKIYDEENNKWAQFFRQISVDYFGDYFVEYKVLVSALEKELSHINPHVVQCLLYILNYEGQTIVSEVDFLRVMETWSAFSANDINNDNMLDLHEIKMLIWLISKEKPTVSELEREMNIMDRDHSHTIDRIEWMSYLCAPVKQSMYQLGNMDYYDFEMRALFESKDVNHDGRLNFEELCHLIERDLSVYQKLDEERQ